MRETIARLVCALAAWVVIALSFLFAQRHNPPLPETHAGTPPAVTPPADAGRGPGIFVAQGCAGCHSLRGVGNPRSALDGIGAGRTREDLRGWITGTGEAAEELPASVVRRKAGYRELPEDELDALILYLSTREAAR